MCEREQTFILGLPRRPGALRLVLTVLRPDSGVARFDYPKESACDFGSVPIGTETVRAVNSRGRLARMDAAGFACRDMIQCETTSGFPI